MKKSTKGALAAGTAAVLLLGGAGSLAYWSDSHDIAGGSIDSGALKLVDTTGTDGSCTSARWAFDADEDTHAGAYEVGDKIVPGDVLTKVCTFDIQAVGRHLSASVSPTGGVNTGSLGSPNVEVTSTYTVDGATLADDTITSANDGKVLRATIKLKFNYGDDTITSTNDTQGKRVNISSYTLAVKQLHSSSNAS